MALEIDLISQYLYTQLTVLKRHDQNPFFNIDSLNPPPLRGSMIFIPFTFDHKGTSYNLFSLNQLDTYPRNSSISFAGDVMLL